MAQKQRILPYQVLKNGDITGNLMSAVTNIQGVDNVGYFASFTGGTGTFSAQVSMDYVPGTFPSDDPATAGTWFDLPLTPTPSAAGVASTAYLELNQLSAPWCRLTFTNTYLESGSITTRADSSGNLASKYFLLNGSDGINYYIWFKVSGTGTDPMVAGRTGVEVDISTNDTAATIGGLLRTALGTIPSINTIGGTTSHATFKQVSPGAGSLSDSIPAPTGFTLVYTATPAGTLQAYITAKAI